MSEELTGEINEVRRRFKSGDLIGDVQFGHQARAGNVHGQVSTPFRVTLADGREGWGRYTNPKNVRVMLKAKRGKYARRRD